MKLSNNGTKYLKPHSTCSIILFLPLMFLKGWRIGSEVKNTCCFCSDLASIPDSHMGTHKHL